MEYDHIECAGCANEGAWCIGCQPMKVGDKFTRLLFSTKPTELHVSSTILCPPLVGETKAYAYPSISKTKED